MTLFRESEAHGAESLGNLARLRSGQFCTVLGIRPPPRRLRDRKCPSRSSWGKVSSPDTDQRGVRLAPKCRKVRVSPTRDVGWREPSNPYLVRPRLVPGGRLFSCRACERKLMHPVRGNPNPRTTRTGGPFDRWGLHLTGSLTPSPARAGWVDTVICSGFGRCVVVLASCPDCRRRREAPDVKSSLRGRRSL